MPSTVARMNVGGGGKIGPELWTRADLEQYHKSNKQQENFLSTPYGGLARRPPASLVGSIPSKQLDVSDAFGDVVGITANAGTGIDIEVADVQDVEVGDTITLSDTTSGNYDGEHVVTGITGLKIECSGSTYGVDDTEGTWANERLVWFAPGIARGFPFTFDINTKYAVILVEYTATGEDTISKFEVVDDTGVSKDTVDAPYVSGEFYEIDHKQIGNVIMFAHPQHAPARLVRNGDTDWAYEDIDFIGGPFLGQNTDREKNMFISIQTWISTGVYGNGEAVASDGGGNIGVSDIKFYNYEYGGAYDWYGIWSYARPVIYSTATVVVGQMVQFPVDQLYKTFDGGGGTYDVIPAGMYKVVAVESGYFQIDFTRTFGGNVGGYTWTYRHSPALNSATMRDPTNEGIYLSKIDGNENNALPSGDENDFWRRTYTIIDANIAATFDAFSEESIGQLIILRDSDGTYKNGSFSSVDSSPILTASGSVVLTTDGIWDGQIDLQISTDFGVSWESIGTMVSVAGDYNGSLEREIPFGSVVRAHMTTYVSGTCEWKLEAPHGTDFVGKIDEVIDANTAHIIVKSTVGGILSTHKWAFGAFGGDMDYPGTITIHEERLMLGGTPGRPFEIYGSEVDNWTNFALATLETSPIIFSLQSDNVTRICWMLSSQNRLFIGTDFGEYSASTPDKDTVLSGVNPPRIMLHTTYGSDEQKALSVHNEIVHITADRNTMRAIAEGEYKETYGSKELTIMAPDISGTGILELALQRNPYPVIWARTADGELKAFTYDIENGILAWSEIGIIDSDVKSHWILPNDDGVDEVYALVERADVVVQAAAGAVAPSPDVTGIFNAERGNVDPPEILVSETLTSADGVYPNISLSTKWRFISSTNMISWNGANWSINVIFGGSETFIHPTSISPLPPKTGWGDSSLGSPAPTLEYDDSKMFSTTFDDFYIEKEADGYSIFRTSDDVELFESATIYGEYTAVAGSGATGSVIISEVKNHVIKFSPSDTYTDLFDEPITSLVEFTSLVQGEGVLEGAIVRAVKMRVFLVASQGGEVSLNGGDSWLSIPYDDDELYTGMKSMILTSGNVTDLRVLVRTTDDTPFNLTGISVEIEKETKG